MSVASGIRTNLRQRPQTKARPGPTDRMRRACTLLVCGWNFQRWNVEGFASIAGVGGNGACWVPLPSPGGPAHRSKAATTSSSNAMTGWQRRRPQCRAPAGSSDSSSSFPSSCSACSSSSLSSWSSSSSSHSYHYRRRSSRVPLRAKASPVLDLQEDGGVASVREDGSEDGDDVSSSDSKGRKGSKEQGGERRKPKVKKVSGKKKIMALLDSLDGDRVGGGAADRDAVQDKEEEEDEDSSRSEQAALDKEFLLLAREEEGEREEMENKMARKEFEMEQRYKRIVRDPVPPLTRSQAEEERFADKVLRIESLLPEINHVNFKEAMGVIQQVVDEHGDEGLGLTEVYRAGMQACVNFGAFEEVLRLLDELKSFRESPPNRHCYDLAILASSKLGYRNEAVATTKEAKKAGYEPSIDSYIRMMRACENTEAGSTVADTLLELHAMDDLDVDGNLPRSIPLCHAYLSVLAAAGCGKEATKFFWGLVSRGKPQPNLACHDAILACCRKNDLWKDAFRVLSHVRREDVNAEPTPMTYLQAIVTMFSGATEEETDVGVRAALSALGEMKKLEFFSALSPVYQGYILHAQFQACRRFEQHWPKAMDVFEQLKESDQTSPTATDYKAMLHMLGKSKEVPRGQNYKKMAAILREAQGLNHRLTEVSYKSVMADCGFAGDVDLAFEIFDEMVSAGFAPSLEAYNRLLGVCEKNGASDRAFNILDEMYSIKVDPDVVSFGNAISACGKGGEWRKSLALLVRMQHDKVVPNLQCMNAAINALGISGEWERAEAMMEVIWKSGMKPNHITYNSLAMAFASAGKTERAFGVLDTMSENGVEPDAITFGTILTACQGDDVGFTIRSLFERMATLGIPKTVIHFTAAMEAANASRYTGVSWELWRIMGVEGIQPNNQAYSTIISAAALDKDVGMAIKLLKEMPTRGIQADDVTYTVAICACNGDWLVAMDFMEEMKFQGVPPTLETYTAVMMACIASEEYREALGIFYKMTDAGITPDIRAYKVVIAACFLDGNDKLREEFEAQLEGSNYREQDNWEEEYYRWVRGMPEPEMPEFDNMYDPTSAAAMAASAGMPRNEELAAAAAETAAVANALKERAARDLFNDDNLLENGPRNLFMETGNSRDTKNFLDNGFMAEDSDPVKDEDEDEYEQEDADEELWDGKDLPLDGANPSP